MSNHAVETFFEGLDFGEGPRWHDDRLWVSDFYQHRVRSFGESGDVRVELELDDQPSGLGWLPNGDLLVVAMESCQVRRLDANGHLHVHADLTSIATGHCNDMVVDSRGNAYVGNFGFELGTANPKPGPGDLALVRADGTTEVAAHDVMVANGAVLTPDEGTLILGESLAARYSAFTIQPDGSLSDRRVWAEVPGKAPDGCTLDARGAIWMADAFGTGCYLVAEGGEILDAIRTDDPIYACVLGGSDGRTLYLLTAPGSRPPEVSGKAMGRIRSTRVEVPGAAWA